MNLSGAYQSLFMMQQAHLKTAQSSSAVRWSKYLNDIVSGRMLATSESRYRLTAYTAIT